MWGDVEAGHSGGGDIRCGSGVEEIEWHDAHCFHSGDALKVCCPPAPPTQEPCSISSSCSAASTAFRGRYVFIANTTNKIDLLCYSDCVLIFCAQTSSWSPNKTFLHLSSLPLSIILLQADYSSLWEFWRLLMCFEYPWNQPHPFSGSQHVVAYGSCLV